MEVSGQLHVPVVLTPGKATLVPNVGTRKGLDVMEKRKISFPYRKSNPNSSVVQPIA
jgi:hypothetical protein